MSINISGLSCNSSVNVSGTEMFNSINHWNWKFTTVKNGNTMYELTVKECKFLILLKNTEAILYVTSNAYLKWRPKYSPWESQENYQFHPLSSFQPISLIHVSKYHLIPKHIYYMIPNISSANFPVLWILSQKISKCT
jgi:hypothetical protein